MKRKSLTKNIIFTLIIILFLVSNIKKSSAYIKFYSNKDHFDAFLNSFQIPDSVNKNNVITEASKYNFDFLNTATNISAFTTGNVTVPIPLSQDSNQVIPSFIKTSLNKDMVNFYDIKTDDINSAILDIIKLRDSSTTTNMDKEFLFKLTSIYNSSKSFFNSSDNNASSYYENIYNQFRDKEDDYYTYNSSYGTATNNDGDAKERIYSSVDDENSVNIVQSLLLREWRVYLYTAIFKLKSDYSNKKISQNILDYVGDKDNGTLLKNIYDPPGTNRANQSLDSNEITNQEVTIGGVTVPLKLTYSSDTGTLIPDTDNNGNVNQDLSSINKCTTAIFMSFNPFSNTDTVVSNPNCSVVAYLINTLLSLLN